MGATTRSRARLVAGGFIAAGAMLIVSASTAGAVTTDPYGPGDPTTTTTPDETTATTTPDETTTTSTSEDTTPGSTSGGSYGLGDPPTSVVMPVGSDTDTGTSSTAADAGAALPRTGGVALPLGLIGVGTMAGGSAILAALRRPS